MGEAESAKQDANGKVKETDRELELVLTLIEKVHAEYYARREREEKASGKSPAAKDGAKERRDKEEKKADTKAILSGLRESILGDVCLQFSGVFDPRGPAPQLSGVWRDSLALGARARATETAVGIIGADTSSSSSSSSSSSLLLPGFREVTHVVASSNRCDSLAVRQALAVGIAVVRCSWVQQCSLQWSKVDEAKWEPKGLDAIRKKVAGDKRWDAFRERFWRQRKEREAERARRAREQETDETPPSIPAAAAPLTGEVAMGVEAAKSAGASGLKRKRDPSDGSTNNDESEEDLEDDAALDDLEAEMFG